MSLDLARQTELLVTNVYRRLLIFQTCCLLSKHISTVLSMEEFGGETSLAKLAVGILKWLKRISTDHRLVVRGCDTFSSDLLPGELDRERVTSSRYLFHPGTLWPCLCYQLMQGKAVCCECQRSSLCSFRQFYFRLAVVLWSEGLYLYSHCLFLFFSSERNWDWMQWNCFAMWKWRQSGNLFQKCVP